MQQASPQKPLQKTKSVVMKNTPIPPTDSAQSPLTKLSLSKIQSQQATSKTNFPQSTMPQNSLNQKSPRGGPQSHRNSQPSSARNFSNHEPVSFRNHQKDFIDKSRERIKNSNNVIMRDKKQIESRFNEDNVNGGRIFQPKKNEPKPVPWSEQLRSGSVS